LKLKFKKKSIEEFINQKKFRRFYNNYKFNQYISDKFFIFDNLDHIKENLKSIEPQIEFIKNQYMTYANYNRLKIKENDDLKSLNIKIPLIISYPKSIDQQDITYDLLYNFYLKLIADQKYKYIQNPRKK